MIENIERMEDHPFFQALLTLPLWSHYLLTQSCIFRKDSQTMDGQQDFRQYFWIPSFVSLYKGKTPSELCRWYNNETPDKAAALKAVLAEYGLTTEDLDNLHIGYPYTLGTAPVYFTEHLFKTDLVIKNGRPPLACGLLFADSWEELDLRTESLRLSFAGRYITRDFILPYVKGTALEEHRDSICRTFMELSTTFEISGYRQI